MPYCGECGFNMPAGVVFCGECGHKNAPAAQGSQPAAAAPAAAAPPKTQPTTTAPPSKTPGVDGEPFPHDSKLCGGCKKPLAGVLRLLTALDQEWHPECFVCSNCKNTFNDDDGKFFVKNGLPVCKNCSTADAPKCAGCFKPCTENFLKALNVSWHSECFVCDTCKKVIGGSFIVRNDRPFCTSICGDHASNKAKPAAAAYTPPPAKPTTTTVPAASIAPAAAASASSGGGTGGGKTKFCGECGNKMDDGKVFCGECGFKMT